MALFDGWKDDKFSRNFVNVLCILVIALSIFISVSTTIDKTLFFYLALSAGFIIVINSVDTARTSKLIDPNFWNSKNRLYITTAMGLVIGTVLGLGSRGGTLNLVLPTQAIYLGDLNFLLANVIAPILEPMFWRGFIFPFFLALFVGMFKKNKFIAIILALVISSFAFGLYHVNVYSSASPGLSNTYDTLKIAVLFGLLFTIATSAVESLGIELGWHFASNLFASGYTTAQIFPTMIVAGIIFIIGVELVDRLK